MNYRSPLAANRRSVLITGVAIGTFFSLVSGITFGRFDALGLVVIAAFGALEGFAISGAGIAIQAFMPDPGRKRLWRMILDFALGASVHALLGLAMLKFTGAGTLFLTGIVGLLSLVVGELVTAKETSILAREDAELAKAGNTRLPSAVREAFSLSDREAEVAELLFARASYKDICDRLFISLPTVKSHVSAIYRKSDVSSRREFIAKAEKTRRD